jgi:hypothetical protein
MAEQYTSIVDWLLFSARSVRLKLTRSSRRSAEGLGGRRRMASSYRVSKRCVDLRPENPRLAGVLLPSGGACWD